MIKTAAKVTAALFGTIVLAAVAFAGYGAHGHNMFGDMGAMDTNQDAEVTFEEYEAAHTRNLKAAFEMLDANNDNVIDKTEWDQFLKVHGMEKAM